MANSRFGFYVCLLSVAFVAIRSSDAAGNCGKSIALVHLVQHNIFVSLSIFIRIVF